MRAMRVHRPGEGLHLDQIEVPVAGPGEIIVWVAACGVCRTDLHIADGDLPLRKTPVVPGHEVVGEVVELGCRRQSLHSRIGSRRPLARGVLQNVHLSLVETGKPV